LPGENLVPAGHRVGARPSPISRRLPFPPTNHLKTCLLYAGTPVVLPATVGAKHLRSTASMGNLALTQSPAHPIDTPTILLKPLNQNIAAATSNQGLTRKGLACTFGPVPQGREKHPGCSSSKLF